MEFKIAERHIDSLYAAQSLFEKRLKDAKKGYAEFQDRTTDRKGVVIAESYMYMVERDEKHFSALNELLKECERKKYAKYLK